MIKTAKHIDGGALVTFEINGKEFKQFFAGVTSQEFYNSMGKANENGPKVTDVEIEKEALFSMDELLSKIMSRGPKSWKELNEEEDLLNRRIKQRQLEEKRKRAASAQYYI